MTEALADMTEHTLASPEGRAADQYFHAALLEASGNPFLVTLTSGVGAAVAWTTIFKQRHMPLSRDPIPDHRRVFEAVAAGNAKAANKAMANLLDSAFPNTPRARPGPADPETTQP